MENKLIRKIPRGGPRQRCIPYTIRTVEKGLKKTSVLLDTEWRWIERNGIVLEVVIVLNEPTKV